MEESLSPEHHAELVGNTLEELLDGGRVTNEGDRHLEASRRNVAVSGLDIVGNPLDEVRRVLGLDVLHLVLDLLHRDLTAEVGSDRQVATVARVTGGHHVLGVKHLRGQLGYRDGTVLLAAASSERSKANHEEVKTGEGHHVDGQLPQVRVELTREAEAGGDTRHDDGDEVVKVTVLGRGELECPEADVVEGLVVNAEGLVTVLNELVDGESCVVRLDDGVRNLGRGHDREGGHHSVGVFLSDLGDEQCTHTGTRTTTERVGDLEALEHVTVLCLLANDIEDRVDELSA